MEDYQQAQTGVDALVLKEPTCRSAGGRRSLVQVPHP
jgi:hypothetical protein